MTSLHTQFPRLHVAPVPATVPAPAVPRPNPCPRTRRPGHSRIDFEKLENEAEAGRGMLRPASACDLVKSLGTDAALESWLLPLHGRCVGLDEGKVRHGSDSSHFTYPACIWLFVERNGARGNGRRFLLLRCLCLPPCPWPRPPLPSPRNFQPLRRPTTCRSGLAL